MKIFKILLFLSIILPSLFGNSFCNNKEYLEEILNKDSTKYKIDLGIKSINGWLRVLARTERIEKFGINISENEKELVVKKLNECANIQLVGRMK